MPLRCRILALAALAAMSPALDSPTRAQTPAPTGQAELLTECEVIARVNSEVILACELDWQVRLMFEERFGREGAKSIVGSPMFAEGREALLKRLTITRIEMALLYADFRSNAPGADLPSIKKQLQDPWEKQEVPRLMKSVGVEELSELEPRLLELGTSLAERREDFFRTMIARTWMTQSVKIDKEVTHEQMLTHYREHAEDYYQPDRVRWEELMVRFDKHPSKPAAYAALARLGNEANAAARAAVADEPAFGAIATARSDGFTAEEGGAYDWTTKDSLAAERVDAALFTLPPGQMSPILEGPMGFHIVRVLERREAGPTSFREVQGAIRKSIQDERFGVAINGKLTELKKSARIWTLYTGDLSYEELAALQAPPTQTR